MPARLAKLPILVVAACQASLLAAASHLPALAVTIPAQRHLARFTSPHYEIRYDPAQFPQPMIEAFAAERERILAAEASLLNLSLASVRLRVLLDSDFDAVRGSHSNHVSFAVQGTAIRAVLAGYIRELDPAADAAALLNAAWGPPGSSLLGGWVARWLGLTAAGTNAKRKASQIESEIGHYSLAELVAKSANPFLSPLVRTPLGAAWAGWVYERFGILGVRRVYQAADNRNSFEALSAQLGIVTDKLESDWSKATSKWRSEFPPVPSSPRRLDPNFFFRGISLSHEGWTGRGGGYASRDAARQIEFLHQMGANAIALVPYGFVPDLSHPNIPYTMTDETDVDLSEAAYVAHRLGMKVMLKPQLWVRHGRFTGAIRASDAAAREAWMRSYREFILHYARLAELREFDLLSIGNELEGLTPDEGAWRQLITEIRRVYRGPLTYAANWDREFDSIRFWDALDYAGLNNYYPLATAGAARADSLAPAAEALATKLAAFNEKWHRPVLFTEVGYPSIEGAAVEPWIEDSGRRVSLIEQAACYEASFRAFPGQPWFRGMFWWKWPSDGRGGGIDDGSYTPLGKPATEVIRRWYTRLATPSGPARQSNP